MGKPVVWERPEAMGLDVTQRFAKLTKYLLELNLTNFGKVQHGDTLEGGVISQPREGLVPFRVESRSLTNHNSKTSKHASPDKTSPGMPLWPGYSKSHQPNTDTHMYRDEPMTGQSVVTSSPVANIAKDIGFTSSSSSILKYEEDQDPGFLMLLDQLSPVLVKIKLKKIEHQCHLIIFRNTNLHHYKIY